MARADRQELLLPGKHAVFTILGAAAIWWWGLQVREGWAAAV